MEEKEFENILNNKAYLFKIFKKAKNDLQNEIQDFNEQLDIGNLSYHGVEDDYMGLHSELDLVTDIIDYLRDKLKAKIKW